MPSHAAAARFDAIVIGSGMGALTVASLLAQLRGRRVLVLERHFKAGGFTHDFTRGRFHWDVGLHYVGEMRPGQRMRAVFDLVTRRAVEWNPMPEPFERFVYPELTFDAYGDAQRFQADLEDRFPAEATAIARYLADIRRTARAFVCGALHDNTAAPLCWAFAAGAWWNGRHLGVTTKDYLDAHFRDPQLKGLLASQWGDYGLPPGLSPFAIHAVIVNHYLGGASYPVGGAGTIAESVRALVEQSGGQVLVNREVTEIVVEGGRAVGVRAQRRSGEKRGPSEEYRAPVIVSGAGAATTFLQLLPAMTTLPFRDRLAEFLRRQAPTTNVSLFLGLKDNPRSIGIEGGNLWIYATLDHDAMFARRRKALEQGRPEQVYASFPSLKDPSARAHTAELITFADFEQFAGWQHQPWRRKDADYQDLKGRIADGMIKLVDARLPGFADLIEFREVATPLTNAYFTGHAQGAIYGLSPVLERFGRANVDWRRARTPIPGLYLTGADLMMGGIVSAMMSGIMTLNALPGGVAFLEAFSAAGKLARSSSVGGAATQGLAVGGGGR